MYQFDLRDRLRVKTPRERWEEFHEENPDVYAELVRLAREWIAATDAPKIGMQQLFEILRWNRGLRTRTSDFKLNNNHAAFYAREIMKAEPDLDGRFEIRRSHADNDKAA